MRAKPDPLIVLRSLLFNLLFWLWTGAMVLVAAPLMLLPPSALVAAGRFWQRGIQALLRLVAGLDYELRGRERIPSGPVIFAVKHQSAWETLATLLLFERPAIALKKELTQIPLFGWYMLRTGMIRIDRARGTRALRSLVTGAKAAIERGASPVIFPEGTRTAPGERRPYHPGIAAVYLQLGRPVVPVALNSGIFWPRRSFVKRPGRIVVEFLPAIEPGLDRKTFMAELEQRLESASDRLVAEARQQIASR